MSVLLLSGALSLALQPAPALAETGRSVIVVLDASGSMNTKLPEGPTRMEAAKDALADLAGKLGDDTRVALRIYGHQSSVQKKDCKDSALVVGFGAAAANRAAIIAQARGVKAQGYTPINYSLQAAAKDLAGEATTERVVLLVSDGKETCEGDPCATAKALAEADAKLVMHVVGFGVDEVTRSQLQCIARNARGSYFDAASAGQLTGVLGRAVVAQAAKPAPAITRVISLKLGKLKLEGGARDLHDIFNAEGKQVGRLFQFGTEVELPAGIYSMQITNGPWTGIEVKSGETTRIKPGLIALDGFDSIAVGNRAHLIEPETGKEIDRFDPYARHTITLIPGRYDVKFGEMLLPGGVEARPGEKTTIRLGELWVWGPSTMYFSVRDLHGRLVSRQSPTAYTMRVGVVALPPGAYELELELDVLPQAQRKMQIEVKAGEKLEIKLN